MTEIKQRTMKKYLAYNGIDDEHDSFETIEDAQKWLEDKFLDPQGYHPETDSCKIFELKQVVRHDVVDSKKNYKYEHEEDIPECDNDPEAWPYGNDFDEIMR